MFFVITVATCVAIVYYWERLNEIQGYGYLGAFLLAFIAGCSLPVPLSYVLVTFTLGGVLSPALVGLASGLGAGTGGTMVYLFGRSGSRFLPSMRHFSVDREANSRSIRLMEKFIGWAEKRGTLVVFAMSVVFNPMFAPMALTLGALRFRMAKFFVMCVAGNTVKSLFLAYAGYLGLGTILRWMGIPV